MLGNVDGVASVCFSTLFASLGALKGMVKQTFQRQQIAYRWAALDKCYLMWHRHTRQQHLRYTICVYIRNTHTSDKRDTPRECEWWTEIERYSDIKRVTDQEGWCAQCHTITKRPNNIILVHGDIQPTATRLLSPHLISPWMALKYKRVQQYLSCLIRPTNCVWHQSLSCLLCVRNIVSLLFISFL